MNRLTAKSYSDGITPSVAYTYSTVTNSAGQYSIGQLVSVANASSTTSYSNFDALGRAQASSQVTAGQTYPLTYSYNISSLTSETYPSGRVITTSYDGANRELAVSGILGGITTNYVGNVAYAAHGLLSSYQYVQVSGQTGLMARANTYNPRLQLSGYTDTNNSTGLQLVNATLNWTDANGNDNGNLQGATYVNNGTINPPTLTFTQTFTYDAVNRLTSANDSGGWNRGFSYDAYGNMWLTPGASSGIPPAGNTPTSDVYTANNQISGTTYDPAGNQQLVNGDTASYDSENHQTSLSFAGATEAYLYDGNGQRVEKAGPNGTTVFVYDAMGKLAAEYSTAVNTSPCATCYLSADHLGTPRLVVDGSANLIGRHDYLPFGEEIAAGQAGRNTQWGPGNDFVNQKFTGKERDSESGLDYFGARYYGSGLGRFTGPDWSAKPTPVPYAVLANPQTLNLYQYMRNNPLGGADQDGHCDWCQKLWNGITGNGWQTDDQLTRSREAVTSNVSFPAIGAVGIPGPPFANQLPGALARETATMESLGVTPLSPGTAGFEAAAEQGAGQINWTLSTQGELLTTPALEGVTHAATAGGVDVLGAGTAQVASGGGQTMIFDITAQSGHYMNGATAAQSESAIQAGVAAFGAFFDSVSVSVFGPIILPPSLRQTDPCPSGGCKM